AVEVPVRHHQGAQGARGARGARGTRGGRREERLLSASPTLLDVLQGFVHELRTAGLPVSMTENLDAMRAVELIDIDDREIFRDVLGATLVKHHRHRRAFDTVFDVYFSLFSDGVDELDDGTGSGDGQVQLQGEGAQRGGGGGDGLSREELTEMLLAALAAMDREELRRLAAIAVAQFAGME